MAERGGWRKLVEQRLQSNTVVFDSLGYADLILGCKKTVAPSRALHSSMGTAEQRLSERHAASGVRLKPNVKRAVTRRTDDIAREYLLTEFAHPIYEFGTKASGDRGFDLWLIDKTGGPKKKVELKAHTGEYKRPSNLFERLIFNAEIERQLFENGETVIARVFTGKKPFRVFIITNAILTAGALLQAEPRYVLRGQLNYDKSFNELA